MLLLLLHPIPKTGSPSSFCTLADGRLAREQSGRKEQKLGSTKTDVPSAQTHTWPCIPVCLLQKKKKKKCYKKVLVKAVMMAGLFYIIFKKKIFCFCVNALPVRKARAVALMAQPFVHWALHLCFALNLVHALSPREAQGKDNSYFFKARCHHNTARGRYVVTVMVLTLTHTTIGK